MASGLVFATVGTTKFDPFVATLTSYPILRVLNVKGYGKLRVQIGNGSVIPPKGVVEGVEVDYFRFKDSINEEIHAADLVISHAGAGSCLEVLSAAKPLVVVVNENLMHNHQLELAEQLQADGHLYYTTCAELENTLKTMNLDKLKLFPPANATAFANFLDTITGFTKKL